MSVQSILRKIRENRLRESKVGAFYFIGNHIVSNNIDMRDGDSYGDYVNYSSHWDLWKSFLRVYPEYKYLDYDYFPRGRVVFDKKNWKYVLYIDDKIKSKEYLDKIETHYNLSKGSYEFGNDEHYQSTQTVEDIDPDELEDDVIFNESLDYYIKRDTY